ncbi:MAG: AAA domain-containing protein [Solirubrobacterales bacterium]
MSIAKLDAEYAVVRDELTKYLLDGGELAIVKAPPGSGKTYSLVEVLSRLAAGGTRIAVAAQTNSQADDICRRLGAGHNEVRVARFSSNGLSPTTDIPSTVEWVTDKNELPAMPGITVATTAKWSLTDLPSHYDLLAVDEAWQMSWADIMQCATVSGRFLLIGDPGQIPPVVTIDVRRWETSPRAPHEAAPEVALDDPTFVETRFVGSLPACRRLPHEAVDFVRPFYDFDFAAYVAPGARGLDLPFGHDWAEALSIGQPLALTIPTPDHGPPIEVDEHIAAAAARVVRELLESGARIRSEDGDRALEPAEIGVTSSHRVMNAALSAALGEWGDRLRVDTPERWQGLERPVMIAVHPLSGVTEPSAFDLDTGRLCVMASRHTAGLIVLTRDHIGETLRNFVPGAHQAPGRPDALGRGHDAHLRFWSQLEATAAVKPLN